MLFSDEGTNLEISGTGAVTLARNAYMQAVWRQWQTGSSPGVASDTAIFEIKLDGSEHFGRIIGAGLNLSPAAINPQNTRAAFQDYEGGDFVISIHSLPDWKISRRLNITQITKAHCPACTPVDYGWMADGNRFFVELTLVGDAEDEGPQNSIGTYIFSDAGADLGRLSPDTAAFQLEGYIHPAFIERHFLGQLSDGSYIFQDFGTRKGGPMSALDPFLVIAKPDGTLRIIFPLKSAIGHGFLSPDGRYLAYVENRQTLSYRTEQHLWVKDLTSGEERELLAVQAPALPTTPDPKVTLNVLGWLEN
jgi:hypothetical protein